MYFNFINPYLLWFLCLGAGYCTCYVVNIKFKSWKLFLAIFSVFYIATEFIIPIYHRGGPYSRSINLMGNGDVSAFVWYIGWYLNGVIFTSLIFCGKHFKLKYNNSLNPNTPDQKSDQLYK